MSKFNNFFSSNNDILFQLEKRQDFAALFKWISQEDKDAIGVSTPEEYLSVWKEVLSTFGQVCADHLAPNAKQLDLEHFELKAGQVLPPPTFVKNFAIIKDLGLSGLGVKTSYGGMGSPYLIEIVLAELMNRACPSTTLGVVWWGPIAHVIENFGSEELKTEYLPRIVSGEMSGNMALTEPDCGSDLAAIKTYAESCTDGSYRLYGTKRFISNGDAEISLVLAKGGKGKTELTDLSLYLAPRTINGETNIQVAKFEEKVGLHGAATCDLFYDGSKAFLLGKAGHGFRYMLSLMNDSRIGVGTQVVGLMQATLDLANNYAQARKSWGKPIAQHELIAEKLLDMEVELKATRSLVYQAAFSRSMIKAGNAYLSNELAAKEAKAVKAEVKRRNKAVRKQTPLIKYWVGERSVVHARNAVQILGGYGFSTEYPAEWWVRESLIYSIYEGTSQMQALLCVKDAIKDVLKSPKEFIEEGVALRIKSLSSKSTLRRKLYKLRQIEHSAVIAILFRILRTNLKSSFAESNKSDVLKMIKILSKNLAEFKYLSPALLHAERITEIKCLVALSECLVLDAEADTSRTWLAERFLNTSLPKADYLKAQIEQDDTIIEERLANSATKETQAGRVSTTL